VNEFAQLIMHLMAGSNSACINQSDARTEFVDGIVSGGITPISIDEHIRGGIIHKASSRSQDLLELLD